MASWHDFGCDNVSPRQLSFACLADGELRSVLAHDTSEDHTGYFLWAPCAFTLTRLLLRAEARDACIATAPSADTKCGDESVRARSGTLAGHSMWRDKRVVELGAGAALPLCVCARTAAFVCATDAQTPLLRLAAVNISQNTCICGKPTEAASSTPVVVSLPCEMHAHTVRVPEVLDGEFCEVCLPAPPRHRVHPAQCTCLACCTCCRAVRKPACDTIGKCEDRALMAAGHARATACVCVWGCPTCIRDCLHMCGGRFNLAIASDVLWLRPCGTGDSIYTQAVQLLATARALLVRGACECEHTPIRMPLVVPTMESATVYAEVREAFIRDSVMLQPPTASSSVDDHACRQVCGSDVCDAGVLLFTFAARCGGMASDIMCAAAATRMFMVCIDATEFRRVDADAPFVQVSVCALSRCMHALSRFMRDNELAYGCLELDDDGPERRYERVHAQTLLSVSARKAVIPSLRNVNPLWSSKHARPAAGRAAGTHSPVKGAESES